MTAEYDNFKFSMPLNVETEKYLKSKGYEKRGGTCAYPEDRENFMVVPFKMWYWEDTSKADVHLELVTKTTTTTKLKVTKRS